MWTDTQVLKVVPLSFYFKLSACETKRFGDLRYEGRGKQVKKSVCVCGGGANIYLHYHEEISLPSGTLEQGDGDWWLLKCLTFFF